MDNGNQRDDNGKFLPGNSLFSGSNGKKNGRPKSLKTEVKDALSQAEDAMPDIILKMIERAKGDGKVAQSAGEYLADRIFGKATQPLINQGRVNITVRYEGVEDATDTGEKSPISEGTQEVPSTYEVPE